MKKFTKIDIMKKLLIFTALFMASSVSFVCAESPVSSGSFPAVPEWREICPSLYLSVDENGDYVLPEKQYWAKRKKSFEQSKHFCRHSYEYDLDKLSECYYLLKKSELRKSKDFATVQKHNAETTKSRYQQVY